MAIAGILQWLWLLIACARDGVGMKLVRPRWTERVARLVKLATPVAIGGGVQQISTMLDVVWASLLPVGTISALYYADRIAQLPLGVVGIAIGTALLPLLARQLRAGQAQSAMANQNRAIEFGLLLSLPAAVALWLLADPIIRMLFERGRFGPDDTLRTAGALAAFAVGLPAFVLVKALTPGFFAREDTRTPLYIAIAAIAVNVALNIAFLYGTTLAQVGIALASSLSGWLNAAMLATVLRRRDQWVPDERLVARSIRMVGAALGMGAALWAAVRRAGAGPRARQPRRHRRPAGRLRRGRRRLWRAGRGAGNRPLLGAALRDAPPAWPQISRPRRTTVTPARSGRLIDGITSTQSS